MKTYRVSRTYLGLMVAAKVVLTAVAAICYILAVTHPTPFPIRLLLLAGLATFGWLMYVRFPKMPTEITLAEDGWVEFRGRRGTRRVRAADIRSIAQGVGRGTVRVRHVGGRIRMANRFRGFYDFLGSVKAINPAIAIKGF